MTTLTNLDLLFWAAGFLSHLGLLFVLVYRRHGSFPFFTALISLGVTQTIVLYLVRSYGTKDGYHDAYWTFALLDTLLQLCVAYEVASRVFRPLNVWAEDLRSSFVGLTAVCFAGATGVTWLARQPARSWVEAFTTRSNLFVAVLMTELLVGMLALSVRTKLPFGTHVATVAQGLGAYSLVSVLIETGHAYFGVGNDLPMFLVLSYVRMAVYLGCVGYWIAGLWPDEQRARIMPQEMRRKIFDLQTQLAYDLQYLRSRKKG